MYIKTHERTCEILLLLLQYKHNITETHTNFKFLKIQIVATHQAIVDFFSSAFSL
jgi:hypothetical protein